MGARHGFRLEVWGDFALFTRPELTVDRVGYDVITPSAARGIITSIWWHPGMNYVIDRIHVLNPIRHTSIRRAEVTSKASASQMRTAITRGRGLPHLDASRGSMLRGSLCLRDVRYVIDAHFDCDRALMGPQDNEKKFAAILGRRLEKGQCQSQPYLGCREFPCSFRPLNTNAPAPKGAYSQSGTMDMGMMLWGLDYSDATCAPAGIDPCFYHAKMVDGVIDVAASEVFR